MTTKEKISDCLLTAVLWLPTYLIFEYFSYDGFTISDGMYWFGTLVGYCIAIFTNKIVKKNYEIKKLSNPNILDDV